MSPDKLNWTDVEDLALELLERHPDKDPMSIRFTELRQLVEALPDFEPEPGQQVNEQILEAIQAHWIEERQDELDDEGDDDAARYQPNRPFRD